MAERRLRTHVLQVCSEYSIHSLHPMADLSRASGLDAGIKLRPTEDELGAIGPAFAQKWREYYADVPDKPVVFQGTLSM
jgi:alcohol oxidase